MAQKYKDTFFRFYFSDKTRLLNLCNALLGTDATDPNELEINTLEETFFSKMKNDISCMFRGRLLILIEQQSTLNPNMPLRFFLYLSRLIEKIFGKELSEQLHGTTPIHLPGFEFFVLYNGQRKAAENQVMKFSDHFLCDTGNFDLKVDFINLNSPYNRDLIAKSLPLEDYCVFVERVRDNRKAGMSEEEAFYEAYNFCLKNRSWMKDFLELHKGGLFKMISTEYNEELALRLARQEGINEGIIEGIIEGKAKGIIEGKAKGIIEGKAKGIIEGKAKGIIEGKAKGIIEGEFKTKIATIKKMLAQNFPIDTIADIVDWSKEDILKIAKE